MNTTRASLLDRLKFTPDEHSWQELVQIYEPLLISWARRAGESEHDAADIAQDVLAVLIKAVPQFQRERTGSFRTWLRTVTHNKLRDRRRRQARSREVGLAPENEPFLHGDGDAFWNEEYENVVCRRALDVMKTDFEPTTWKACWEFVAMGRPAADVARELGISTNAVYVAKCRVISRLRQTLDGLLD